MCTAIAISRSTFATSIRNTCNIPLKHLKHTLATCVFSITSTCCSDDSRPVDAELDATEWRAALVEKKVDAAENATAGGWPGGEKGWRATTLERGGERGRRLVEHGGEHRGGMVALEHARGGGCRGGVVVLERARGDADVRWCDEWRETDDTSRYGWGERISKWRVGPLG
jgi:hypothetical protein